MDTIRFTAVVDADRVIRLPADAAVPSGPVEVTVTLKTMVAPKRTTGNIAERLAAFAEEHGKDADLPADFAENHDHYIHGLPKGIDRP
jgi:hypothetical protein